MDSRKRKIPLLPIISDEPKPQKVNMKVKRLKFRKLLRLRYSDGTEEILW